MYFIDPSPCWCCFNDWVLWKRGMFTLLTRHTDSGEKSCKALTPGAVLGGGPWGPWPPLRQGNNTKLHFQTFRQLHLKSYQHTFRTWWLAWILYLGKQDAKNNFNVTLKCPCTVGTCWYQFIGGDSLLCVTVIHRPTVIRSHWKKN